MTSRQKNKRKFLSLIQVLFQKGKDFDFLKNKCLSVSGKVEQSVKDLISYLEHLRPGDVLKSVELTEPNAQEVFQDNDSLMEKYSILLDALDETGSPDAFKVVWLYQIVTSQNAIYFKQNLKNRIAIRIEQLV